MRPTVRPRIKVCCIKSIEEAWLGHRGRGVGPRSGVGDTERTGVISDDTAAEIAAAVPPGIDAFLLTALQQVDALVRQNRFVKARALQLVDTLPAGAHAELRRALPA